MPIDPDKLTPEQRLWWDSEPQSILDAINAHPPGYYSLRSEGGIGGGTVMMVIVGGITTDGKAVCAPYDLAYLAGEKDQPAPGEWTEVDWEHLDFLSINDSLKAAWVGPLPHSETLQRQQTETGEPPNMIGKEFVIMRPLHHEVVTLRVEASGKISQTTRPMTAEDLNVP